MLKKTIALFFLVLSTGIMKAQLEKLRGAFVHTQAGNLDSAKVLIDAASKHPETMSEGQTWYVKGFIYKELFKKSQLSKRDIAIAGEALQACKKSSELDTTSDNRKNNNTIIKSLIAIVNNTFGEALDTVNYKKSYDCIALQKQLVKFNKPSANIDSVETYYYAIIGSYFQSVYEKNPKANGKYLTIAENAYNKVLIVDPNNISANYNMGIIYYNQAVGLIMNKLDYDFDLATLNDIQDEALVWFKKSLPYMEKAYQLNPHRKETLIGLSGIYYSLHDTERSQQFQKLSEDIGDK